MKFFWTVRIYNKSGYAHTQIATDRNLRDIAIIQEFYKSLTGHPMLIEGMSEVENPLVTVSNRAFDLLWEDKLGEEKR